MADIKLVAQYTVCVGSSVRPPAKTEKGSCRTQQTSRTTAMSRRGKRSTVSGSKALRSGHHVRMPSELSDLQDVLRSLPSTTPLNSELMF